MMDTSVCGIARSVLLICCFLVRIPDRLHARRLTRPENSKIHHSPEGDGHGGNSASYSQFNA